MENKNNDKTYFDSAHRLGRIATIVVVGFMLGIPIFIAKYYNLKLDMKEVFSLAAPLLAVFVPVALSEFFSYMPILGTASYLTYLTGNVLNLKIPCVINAQELTDSEQGTERGDVVALLAVSASAITTMTIIIIGIILMIPLEPIFKSDVITTATKYILPALFGAMIVPLVKNNKVGKYRVKNKIIPILVPVAILTMYNYFISPIAPKQGYWILITIIISIAVARVMYNKGMITMEKIEDTEKKE